MPYALIDEVWVANIILLYVIISVSGEILIIHYLVFQNHWKQSILPGLKVLYDRILAIEITGNPKDEHLKSKKNGQWHKKCTLSSASMWHLGHKSVSDLRYYCFYGLLIRSPRFRDCLCTCAGDGMVKLWNTDTLTCTTTINVSEQVSSSKHQNDQFIGHSGEWITHPETFLWSNKTLNWIKSSSNSLHIRWVKQ
jgi:hypothetical protein